MTESAAIEKTRILVVDDAADTRLLLNLRLQREGYEVFTASSGAEALDVIQKEGLPHLVLLDIMMPGM
ncbi:MAG: response regulator, partial [Caldilineaceae bacterium]|nr:response regulator [Caldilineaceae bacterium]